MKAPKNFRQGGGVSLKTMKKQNTKKSKKILVPIDGSSNSFRALTYAVKFAQTYNHTILGLHVVPYQVYLPHASSKLVSILKKNAKHFLIKAQKICVANNVAFFPKVLVGNPGKKIVDFAKKNKIDQIVIGHNNKGKLESLFLGSTSNYIIHKFNRPVTLIK